MSWSIRSSEGAPPVTWAPGDEDSAAAVLFPLLCQRSPALRQWLWEDFARDAKTRTRFAQALDGHTALPISGVHALDDISGNGQPWQEERRRLKQEMPHLVRPYGGLTWGDIETLVRRYQAGTIDLAAFLLAQGWREAGEAARSSPALTLQAATFIDAIVRLGQKRLLPHLGKALLFLDSYQREPEHRAAFGYADWWKVQALFYILRHPKPSYRTRELCLHLASLGLRVSAKDVRRFCIRHKIRRNSRAGRPRAQPAR